MQSKKNYTVKRGYTVPKGKEETYRDLMRIAALAHMTEVQDEIDGLSNDLYSDIINYEVAKFRTRLEHAEPIMPGLKMSKRTYLQILGEAVNAVKIRLQRRVNVYV